MSSHAEAEDYGAGVGKVGNVTIGSIAGDEARQGTEHEHRLSLLEAMRLYPTAVGWSIYFSLGVSESEAAWSCMIAFTEFMIIES